MRSSLRELFLFFCWRGQYPITCNGITSTNATKYYEGLHNIETSQLTWSENQSNCFDMTATLIKIFREDKAARKKILLSLQGK